MLVKTSGDTLWCNILKEDSRSFYILEEGKANVPVFEIEKTNIRHYIYDPVRVRVKGSMDTVYLIDQRVYFGRITKENEQKLTIRFMDASNRFKWIDIDKADIERIKHRSKWVAFNPSVEIRNRLDTVLLTDGRLYIGRITREDSSYLRVKFRDARNKDKAVVLKREEVERVASGVENIEAYEKIDWITFGPGYGMEYGGIGTNTLIHLSKGIGVFLGVGSFIADIGYNAGIKLRFDGKMEAKRISSYATVMYGYKHMVFDGEISRQNDDFMVFQGFSFGFGLDIALKSMNAGRFSVSLTYSGKSDVENYFDNRPNYYLDDRQLKSLRLGLGYRLPIKSKYD